MNAFGDFLYFFVLMTGSPSQMCTPHTIYGVVTLFNTLHVVFALFFVKKFCKRYFSLKFAAFRFNLALNSEM